MMAVVSNNVVGYTQDISGRKLARESNGRLWAAYEKSALGVSQVKAQVFVAHSDDEGATWNEEQVTYLDVDQRGPSIAIGSSDELHLVYYSSYLAAHPYGIYYNQRSGGVWLGEETVYTTSWLQDYPAIAVDSVGDVHVVWRGRYPGWGGTHETVHYRKRESGVWQAIEHITNLDYSQFTPV